MGNNKKNSDNNLADNKMAKKGKKTRAAVKKENKQIYVAKKLIRFRSKLVCPTCERVYGLGDFEVGTNHVQSCEGDRMTKVEVALLMSSGGAGSVVVPSDDLVSVHDDEIVDKALDTTSTGNESEGIY